MQDHGQVLRLRELIKQHQGWKSLFFRLLVLFVGIGYYCCVCWSQNRFFELPRKTMQNLLEITSKSKFGTETCKFGPKLWLRSCPDLPRPVQEDKSLSTERAFPFFLFLRNYTFPMCINKFIMFLLNQICYQTNLWSFNNIICFTKQIHDF